jgi:hypothetical protein
VATSLFAPPSGVPFAGAEFDEQRDRQCLTKQLDCILDVVKDQKWRTLQKLTADLRRRFPIVNFPECSVQAQLRNLRKIGYTVDRRNVLDKGCLFEYRVIAPAKGATC